MAAFLVTSTADNPQNPQPGTLRYAIQQVNGGLDRSVPDHV